MSFLKGIFGSKAELEQNNRILELDEIWFEIESSGRMKARKGNAVDHYADLHYWNPSGSVAATQAARLADTTVAAGTTIVQSDTGHIYLRVSAADPTQDIDLTALAPHSAAGASGITATSTGISIQTTVLPFVNIAVPITDEAGVVAYGGIKILDLPDGAVNILGAIADLALTQASDQLETATVTAAAGATAAGNLTVTVTGTDLVGSPLAVLVPLLGDATDDSATKIAAKIRTKLATVAAITNAYTVPAASAATFSLLRVGKTNGPDATLNIAITAGLGVSAAATSANTYTGINADWDGDFSVGTVTASNNNSLASTEQNIIPTTSTPQAVAAAATAKGVIATPAVFDGTTTAIDVFLNFLIDDADHNVGAGTAQLTVNGTVTLFWFLIGDYAS